jgi:hypothetical protein
MSVVFDQKLYLAHSATNQDETLLVILFAIMFPSDSITKVLIVEVGRSEIRISSTVHPINSVYDQILSTPLSHCGNLNVGTGGRAVLIKIVIRCNIKIQVIIMMFWIHVCFIDNKASS